MKIPVFAIIGQTFAFVWGARQQFLTLAMPAIVLTAIPAALFSGFLWYFSGQPETELDFAAAIAQIYAEDRLFSAGGVLLIALYVAIILISICVYIMYSIAWHRVYLLPGQAMAARTAYAPHRRQLQFLFNYLKLAVLAFLFLIVYMIAMVPVGFVASMAGAALGTGIGVFVITVVTQGILWVGLLWLYARFAMLFPATAVDNHMKIRDAYRMSRDNGWRLFWVVVIVAVPVMAVSIAISLLLSATPLAFEVYGSLTVSLLTGLINQALSYVGVALGVTALSIAYDRLRNRDASGVFA